MTQRFSSARSASSVVQKSPPKPEERHGARLFRVAHRHPERRTPRRPRAFTPEETHHCLTMTVLSRLPPALTPRAA